jgi:hypothetical protein
MSVMLIFVLVLNGMDPLSFSFAVATFQLSLMEEIIIMAAMSSSSSAI